MAVLRRKGASPNAGLRRRVRTGMELRVLAKAGWKVRGPVGRRGVWVGRKGAHVVEARCRRSLINRMMAKEVSL